MPTHVFVVALVSDNLFLGGFLHIRFYCLHNRGNGASLMAKAAIASHVPALYSLAIIQFNGSRGGKKGKDLKAGVTLCARAAFLGHIDALPKPASHVVVKPVIL